MFSSTTCDSAWIFTVSWNLCPFNWIFIFGTGRCQYRQFLSFAVWYRRFLHTPSQLHFWSSFSRWSTNFEASSLMFMSLVKMHSLVMYNKPKMLQVLSITHHLSSWMTWHILSIFSSISNMNIQNPEPKFGHFWNVNTIHRFVFKSWHQRERLCKLLLCLRSSFLNFKLKFDANFLFLKVCHFPGPKQSLAALNTKTLKRQMHKNTTFCYDGTHHRNSH